MPSGKRDDRRYARLELTHQRLNATLAIVHDNKVAGCLVPVKDFSKSGAGIYAKFSVDPQTLIRLSVEGFEGAPLEGRVVWCGPSATDPDAPPTHPFRLGIDFTPIDDSSRENQIAVYQFVSQLVETEESDGEES